MVEQGDTNKVKLKYQAFKTFKRNKTKENLIKYAKVRNETLGLMRKMRQKYENELSKGAKKNPKKLAKYIRSQGKTKDRVNLLVKQDGSDVNTGEEIAQELHNFFCSVFVEEKDGELPAFPDRVLREDCLESIEVTMEEVRKQIKVLDEDKAPGPDDVSPFLLKRCCDEVAHPLSVIYKLSLKEGQLPEQWKRASVVPIFKAGSKKSPNNYRPVSLTSQVCKILERIIKEQMTRHLMSKHLISAEQHGFVQGKSCLTNLLEALEDWTQILDENHYGLDIIYCDFRKAFDSVPHRRHQETLCIWNQGSGSQMDQQLSDWKEARGSGPREDIQPGGSNERRATGVGVGTYLVLTLCK